MGCQASSDNGQVAVRSSSFSPFDVFTSLRADLCHLTADSASASRFRWERSSPARAFVARSCWSCIHSPASAESAPVRPVHQQQISDNGDSIASSERPPRLASADQLVLPHSRSCARAHCKLVAFVSSRYPSLPARSTASTAQDASLRC